MRPDADIGMLRGNCFFGLKRESPVERLHLIFADPPDPAEVFTACQACRSDIFRFLKNRPRLSLHRHLSAV